MIPEERTLSIIKPDAVRNQKIGPIYTYFSEKNLHIVAAKMIHLTHSQAARLYAVHQQRPFFENLVAFISSGPIMLQVLSGENVISRYRTLMGATDPQHATPGTLRAEFGASLVENAVHGSDSLESAAYEISIFFQTSEIYLSNLSTQQ